MAPVACSVRFINLARVTPGPVARRVVLRRALLGARDALASIIERGPEAGRTLVQTCGALAWDVWRAILIVVAW